MNQRPINTLEEDFRLLGLLTEQDGGPGGNPQKMKQLQKQQAQLAKKRIQFQKKAAKLGMPQEDIDELMDEFDDFAEERGVKGTGPYKRTPKGWLKGKHGDPGKFIRRSKKGKPVFIPQDDADFAPYSDEDIDLDFDGEEMEEARRKIHHLKGVKALRARQKSRKYRKAHKAQLAQMRKTSAYKRYRKKLAKLKKAPKGWANVLKKGMAASREMGNLPMQIEGIGDAIDALRFDNRSQQLEAAFLDLARLATVTGRSYMELSEDYFSTNVDFSVIAEACSGIAAEAAQWAEALNEHDDDIRVVDRELIESHISELISELDDIMEMHDDFRAIIGVDEGIDEDDDEFELEEGMAFAGDLYSASSSYGESPYSGPVKGWKNADMHEIGNVMHPLGLQVGIRRLSDDEKKNLQGLGYGVGLGMDPY